MTPSRTVLAVSLIKLLAMTFDAMNLSRPAASGQDGRAPGWRPAILYFLTDFVRKADQ
jgi:hypothetical protein